MIIRQTILQLKHHMKQRVASVNSIFIGPSNELAFESGLTVKLRQFQLLFLRIMTILSVGFTNLKFPDF